MNKVHHGFISPTEYLHLIPESATFHLLLASLLKDERYASFYRKRQLAGDYIVVDNMAFEDKVPLEIGEYFKLVNDSGIIPDVVIASDHPFKHWEVTVESTVKFLKAYGNYFDPNITGVMAVPQSEKGDWIGWIKAYTEFALIDDIDFIGMSILGIPNAFCSITGTDDITFNRIMTSLYLKNNNIVNMEKKHHYLGCGDPRELLVQKEIGIMYSNDSSTAFWSAINGKRFDRSSRGLIDGKVKREVDFNLEFNEAHVEDIDFNVKWIENLIK